MSGTARRAGVAARLAFKSLAIAAGIALAPMAAAQAVPDWVTGFPRTTLPVKAWPNGRKVAVCFVLYVEDWGRGQGPVFRQDMVSRKPDLLNDAWRRYAIDWGVPRAAQLFAEQKVPLSIALNANFPSRNPEAWKALRTALPNAAIVAHGFNNSTEMLPLNQGVDVQADYVRRVLDLIEKDTGVRPRGWSSPSVYNDADTFAATAHAGIAYTLDSMDSDVLSRLATPAGSLLLIPYPATPVDMGQFLTRNQQPTDLERLWIDYVSELDREATRDPARPATVVAIGLHPFVIGTPDGAASFRRVLESVRKLKNVWLADTEAVYRAAPAGP